jgi:hypothetical protein
LDLFFLAKIASRYLMIFDDIWTVQSLKAFKYRPDKLFSHDLRIGIEYGETIAKQVYVHPCCRLSCRGKPSISRA